MEINKQGQMEQNVFTGIFEGERQEKSVEKKKKKKRQKKKKKNQTRVAVALNESQEAFSLDRKEQCPRYYEAESSHDMEGGENSGFIGQKLGGVGNPNASGHKKHQKREGAGEINASDSKNYHKRKWGDSDTFGNKKHWKDKMAAGSNSSDFISCKKPRNKLKDKSVEEILRNEHKKERKLRMETCRKVSNEKIKRKMLIQARQARARGLYCE